MVSLSPSAPIRLALLLLGALASLGGRVGPERLTDTPLVQQHKVAFAQVSVDGVGQPGGRSLTVLTYNVAALPFPLATRRRAALGEIGHRLAAMRAAGTAPDVVVLQEGFSADTDLLIGAAGYAYRASGPSTADRATSPPPMPAGFAAAARTDKGETFGPIQSSGLYVLTDFPIIDKAGRPFGVGVCAGFDCLANKGALAVRLVVPDVPVPVTIVTTHLNARRSSGVSVARANAAHEAQSARLGAFVKDLRAEPGPMILAGDVNSRRAADRFAILDNALEMHWVRRFCAQGDACGGGPIFAGTAPWLRSQDLQAFESGGGVSLHPAAAELWFTGEAGEAPLSDHAGYLVRYDLRWPAQKSVSLASLGQSPDPKSPSSVSR